VELGFSALVQLVDATALLVELEETLHDGANVDVVGRPLGTVSFQRLQTWPLLITTGYVGLNVLQVDAQPILTGKQLITRSYKDRTAWRAGIGMPILSTSSNECSGSRFRHETCSGKTSNPTSKGLKLQFYKK